MPKTESKFGSVRIISGSHRSRKIVFKPNHIRPTTDRIRETLFNWLAPYIHDAVCLDLFSGSGVLGFEALSRGARSALMIDKQPENIQQLRENQLSLQLKHCDIRLMNISPNSAPISSHPFDIIFIDPPYRENLLMPTLSWLKKTNTLHQNTLVYVECEKELDLTKRPVECDVFRYKKTSHIQYALLNSFNLS